MCGMQCSRGSGKFERRWKMGNRRSRPKRTSCARSLAQTTEVISNTCVRNLKLLNGNQQCSLLHGYNHSPTCRIFNFVCPFQQTFIVCSARQLQLSFCPELFKATEKERIKGFLGTAAFHNFFSQFVLRFGSIPKIQNAGRK